jgi:hypothetical protein
LEDRIDALGRLGAYSQVFDNREHHPWRGFTDTTVGVREREELESSLRLVLAYAQQFQCRLPEFASLVAENDQLSLSDLEQLVEDQFGMSRSDFPRAIGRLFGLFRVPANVADYISDVVNALVDRGTLREDGDRISLPD